MSLQRLCQQGVEAFLIAVGDGTEHGDGRFDQIVDYLLRADRTGGFHRADPIGDLQRAAEVCLLQRSDPLVRVSTNRPIPVDG